MVYSYSLHPQVARKDASQIVACLSLLHIIENKEGQKEPVETRLASVRKCCAFISQRFGLSLGDLPGPMKQKVDAFSRVQEPDAPKRQLARVQGYSVW